MAESIGPILHVIVVGFHHKKGCQVEYSFPPLVPGAPNECPLGWKYLPTLALPDGSHNYDEDTVYFHLPSLNDAKRTIYGISCFRQIPVEKLKNRTSDITRGTVQKSVCVLSTLPLYGHIQVKMALITHAYFEEGDFSKVSLLEDTYHHLNSCMSSESQIPPQVFVGLSARDFILQFRHKVLLLFKLLLLEKKIVFYQSPVQPLCAAILTLLSLFPGMIEHGLQQAAYVRPSRPMSPIPTFDEEEVSVNSIDNNVLSINSDKDTDPVKEHVNGNSNKHSLCINDNKAVETMEVQSVNTITLGTTDTDNTLPRDTSNDALSDARLTNNITQIAHINPELCGMPLSLFTKGYLCLPYLSLPYLDLLADVNVRGYIVGVTNVLFKQKKQLIDVLVEVENTRIETTDPELRRQLHLTTEDLRFADYIVRHVAEPRKDIFLDGVGWEGGDEWIRTQFRVYLLSMLRTSMQQDTRQSDHYNSAFIAAWRTTNNYKAWSNSNKPEIDNVEHGGALSQAKGAFSNWWSTLTTVQPVEEGKADNQTSNIHQTLTNITNKTTIKDEEMNVSTNNTNLEVVLD
ncbi:Late secretory pathway protein AVL9 like protein [Dufourea novaeangliae]|uniref:Late secretory pathway protein AVL9 like protein n=1 Tax=Dufourea novaeangliae TaxID=178035 RepID=A0A154PU00_DUFNO|nr:Late secretory pathway protein AVL9 like protein [Dufourea novaeangliae]